MAENEPKRNSFANLNKKIDQVIADKQRLKEAIGGGVRVRIVTGPLTEIGGEKDPFTEKDIDKLTAKLWV